MNKTICTIIKAGLVAAGLMSEVTLTAWFCEYCQIEHEFDACPNNAMYVNPGPSRVANFPLVGYVMDSDEKEAVYGPVTPDGTYRTLSHVRAKKVADQWVLVAGFGLLAKANSLFDGDGTPLRQVGALANDDPVYEMPRPTASGWYAVRGRYNRIRETSRGEGNVCNIQKVYFVHGHFVYAGYKFYVFPSQVGDPKRNPDGTSFLRGAYFDGLRWVDKHADQIYNSPEEMPQGAYDPNAPRNV
ncbi:MAG: hypothetical protein LBJ78_02630 [Puniceicoccales bacterium]|jgi:hypothetical protein|nr:hypothetical protein [Puniceicoccales bacterium]